MNLPPFLGRSFKIFTSFFRKDMNQLTSKISAKLLQQTQEDTGKIFISVSAGNICTIYILKQN